MFMEKFHRNLGKNIEVNICGGMMGKVDWGGCDGKPGGANKYGHPCGADKKIASGKRASLTLSVSLSGL